MLIFAFYYSEPFPIRHVRTDTLLLFLLAIGSFIIGYLFSILNGRGFFEKENRHTFIKIDYQKLRNVNVTLILLSILGMFIAIREIGLMAGDSMIFFSNPYKVRVIVTSMGRSAEYVPTLLYKLGSYLINLGIISAFSSALLITDTKFRISAFAPFFLGILSSLIYFSRYLLLSYILFFIISIFLLLSYLPEDLKQKTKKRFLSIIFISILTGIAISAIIILARNFYLDKFGELLGKQVYYYITGGLATFDSYLIHGHQFFTYGLSMTRGLNDWFIKFGLLDASSVPQGAGHEFVKVAPQMLMNTYTFTKTIYEDFGTIGLAFVPFLWGYISCATILKFLQKFSWIKLYFSTILIFSMIMSFFGFYLEGISVIVFRAILVYALGYVIKEYCNLEVITTRFSL